MASTPRSPPAPSPWPVQVRTVGQASAGAVVWRYRGRLALTAVVKASFSLVHGGPMTPAPPDEVWRADIHPDGNPRRSLLAASDLAPYLAQADVVLTGHSVPRPGEPSPAVLRLAVVGEQLLFDKTVHLHRGGGVAAAVPVPLVYEEAAGGPGRDDNPAGNPHAPRLVDPGHAGHPGAVACFAPVPQRWPSRARLLGGLDRRGLDELVVDLPQAFDWTYFQAAPVDQRTEHLRGDEWLLLLGMHPVLPEVKTQLPSVRARGELRGLPGEPSRALAMVLDTVHVDVDRQRCSVVFRGHVHLPSEQLLPGLELVLGVSSEDVPTAKPTEAKPPGVRRPSIHPATMTLPVMSGALGAPGALSAPFPLAGAGTRAPTAAPIAGAPWASWPAGPSAAPPPAVPPSPHGSPGLLLTMALDRAELPPASQAALPFASAAPGAARAPAPVIAGAPWAGGPAVPPPLIVWHGETVHPHSAHGAEPSPPPPPEPEPPPAEPELPPLALAPEPAPTPVARAPIPAEYAAAPEPAAPPAAAPAPRRPREPSPAEAVRGTLYGRFGPPKR